MKEKEEDEERNENICPQTNREQTIKQTLREQSMNSKTEATLILCGSSGERANMFPNPEQSDPLSQAVPTIVLCDYQTLTIPLGPAKLSP